MTTPHLASWVFWLVSAVLVLAAAIDGPTRKVPNWLTFPFAIAGLCYAFLPGGLDPLSSFLGFVVGLGLLLVLHAIGGMGAGDVKLLAGVGAWVGPLITLEAFAATALVGGAIGLGMMVVSGRFMEHWTRMLAISQEILVVQDPVKLSATAAQRKPSMTLLPYAIPMAIGTIGCFVFLGFLVI